MKLLVFEIIKKLNIYQVFENNINQIIFFIIFIEKNFFFNIN